MSLVSDTFSGGLVLEPLSSSLTNAIKPVVILLELQTNVRN